MKNSLKKLWHQLPTIVLMVFVAVSVVLGISYFTRTIDGSDREMPEYTVTHYAKITIRDYGTFTVALAGEAAPRTVANFVDLAESGFYDGLTIHRVVKRYVMQGGCPNGDGSGTSGSYLYGEFANNDFDNPLPHLRGAISMARETGFNSASCQFFIVHDDQPQLDGSYAVFGYVVEGYLEVVDKICSEVEPGNNTGLVEKDKQPVIEKIEIIPVTSP